MTQRLLIAAGIDGLKKIQGEHQPYLNVEGKTHIEIVTSVALESSLFDKIVIWGERKKLNQLLPKHIVNDPKILIVNQQSNFVDSFLYAWLNASQPVPSSLTDAWPGIDALPWETLQQTIKQPWIHVITCDTPWLTESDLQKIIASGEKQRKQQADIVLGRTTWHSVSAVLEQLKQPFSKEHAVKNAYTFHINGELQEVIVNSYFSGNPLAVDTSTWKLIRDIISNRTIIKGGRRDWKKIRWNLRLFIAYFRTHVKTKQLDSLFFLTRSFRHVIHGKHKINHRLRDLNQIYKHLDRLTNCKVRLAISDSFGSAFDIDTDYEYDFVKKNFQLISKIRAESP